MDLSKELYLTPFEINACKVNNHKSRIYFVSFNNHWNLICWSCKEKYIKNIKWNKYKFKKSKK